MKILVTGSNGFVGRNLVESLKNIRDNKDRTRPNLKIEEIYEYGRASTEEELERYCSDCDFVFNLAGVNRPKDNNEFMEGNFGFASKLLKTLKKKNNRCPVMLSSSIQATLVGKYNDSDYGKSKLEGEKLFFSYAKEKKLKFWFIDFLTCLENGVSPTTTALWPLGAITMRTIWKYR